MLPLSWALVLARGLAQDVPDFGASFKASEQDNMNGQYPFSSTPGGKPGLFPKHYRDYPGGVEHFDVYSPPMTTLYSQVWWKPLPPVPLPFEIIEKYKNRGMAIVGYEIDQVRRTDSGDVSVPISASYNHHFTSFIVGAGASFRRVAYTSPEEAPTHAEGCGRIPWDQPQYVIDGPELSQRGLATRQMISSGNGGEYRKTYHGFAPGHALVIDSPTSLQVNPMQIDTWNREAMDISGPLPPKFVPGPQPRASLARGGNETHSGLLECPMTTRLTKVVDSAEYVAVEEGACEEAVMSFYECFQAAEEVFGGKNVIKTEAGRDAGKPQGCSATEVGGGQYRVFFNEVEGAKCSAAEKCVCPKGATPFGGATGALLYHPTNQSVDVGRGKAAYFREKCAKWPSTDLLEQRNPTCDIRYYKGGQWACNHMWSLLDADQEIPWADKPLVFHHKYRFWVQPYKPEYHRKVVLGETAGSALLLGSPWEYDVPKCAPNVPGCEMVDGTWVHTIKGSHMGRHTFVTLNNHCHAPTCLSTSVYVCPKGTKLADCNTTNGKLICQTHAVYGGTDQPGIAGTRFDETGYIAIAECIWGSSDYGLETPPDLEGLPLHIVKKANATAGHYGEMSGGQPWVQLHHETDVLI